MSLNYRGISNGMLCGLLGHDWAYMHLRYPRYESKWCLRCKIIRYSYTIRDDLETGNNPSPEKVKEYWEHCYEALGGDAKEKI